jgi:Cu/Ag efflux protein CusF
MTQYRKTLAFAAIILATSLAALAMAQTTPAAGTQKGMPMAAAPAGDMVDGEVRKVDKDTRKITLKHGDIKNLDMPGMTMVFQVKDPAMLDAVKAGDKVKFKAAQATGGVLVITEIQVVK